MPKVRRVQILDNLWRDLLYAAEASDHAREQDHYQVGRVLLHARILQRQDFIRGSGQTHRSIAMERAVRIQISERERELDLGLEYAGVPRSRDGLMRAQCAHKRPRESRSTDRCPWR